MSIPQWTTALVQQLNCTKNELGTKSIVEEAELDCNVMFLLLQETWNNKNRHPPELPLFYLFRVSNKDTKCATYVRKDSNIKHKHHYTYNNFMVSITVEIPKQRTQILNIYSPGRSRYFADISNYVTTIQNCLLMGDFNCNHQLWYGNRSQDYNILRGDRTNGRKIKRWLDKLRLYLVNEPGEFTHFPRNGYKPTTSVSSRITQDEAPSYWRTFHAPSA